MTNAALIRFVREIPEVLATALDFVDEDAVRRAVLVHMEAGRQQLEDDAEPLPFGLIAAALREARYAVAAVDGCPRSARLARTLRSYEDRLVALRDQQARR